MRGTVWKLKFKSDRMVAGKGSDDSWSEIDDPSEIEEDKNEMSLDCEVDNVKSFNGGSLQAENKSVDEENHTLMLCEVGNVKRFNGGSPQAENKSVDEEKHTLMSCGVDNVKSFNGVCPQAENKSVDQEKHTLMSCGVDNVKSFNGVCPQAENKSVDEEKHTLMSSLKLHSIHSPSIKSQSPPQRKLRARSLKVPANGVTCLTATPHSPLPIFNWNDGAMWKAMAEHPLFPKYMELQTELNELFERIRRDCKNAACEKAFASLVKDLNYSSKPLASKYVIPKYEVFTNGPITKKRGKPPLKFKDGPPRKRGRPPLKSYASDNVSCPSRILNSKEFSPTKSGEPQQLVKSPVRGTLRTTRRSIDTPIQEFWPSRKCKNCFRTFSAAKWFEKHIAICTSVRSPEKIQQSESVNDEKDKVEGFGRARNNIMFEEEKEKFVESAISSSVSAVSSSPNFSPGLYEKDGGNENKYVPQTPLVPVSPSSKMTPAGCHMPRQNSSSYNIWGCASQKAPFLQCDGCFRCFTYPASLEKHKRLCVKREKTVSSSTNACESDAEELDTDVTTPVKEDIKSEISSGEGDSGNGEDRTSCNSCQKVFLKHGMLERHEKVCHLNRSPSTTPGCVSLICEKCSRSFLTKRKKWQHQAFCCPELNEQSQVWIKHLKCMNCLRRFPSYKKQLKHRALCCPDRETDAKVCKKCLKVFLMVDRMEAHRAHCSQDR